MIAELWNGLSMGNMVTEQEYAKISIEEHGRIMDAIAAGDGERAKKETRESEGELVNYLVRNEKQNKSYAYDKEVPNSKKAILHYRLIARSQNYYLLEIDLKTGRHHQIRCQLAKMGCPIKGDLKYGSPRSNPDGSICLHARFVRFVHPVSKKLIEVEAPVPAGNLWNGFEMV